MIDWTSIRAVVKKQIADFTGLDDSAVRWVDEPSGTLAGALPVIWLRVSSINEIGDDEERYDASQVNIGTTDDDQLVMVCGQRQFTLSIRAESLTADLSNPLSAANLVGQIKIRMSRTSAQLERSGIYNVIDWLNTKWFSYLSDGERAVNVYVCDLKCVTVDNDENLDVDAGAWIGETLIASTPLNDQDGNPTNTQVSLDVNAK